MKGKIILYFEKVKWKNFLSYGNDFTELKLDEYDTTLIIGENGAGKSVLTEVMSFILYGKPFRKINKPQLINTINNGNLLVELEFNVNNHKYKIVRGMKPNIFEVWEDGVLLNQDASNIDYQSYLEDDVLGMNYITFTQLIVLGKATHTPFMQLPVMKRREMIEHLLGIKVFYDIKVIVKEKLKNANYDFRLYQDKLELEQEKLQMNVKYQNNTSIDKQQLIDDLTIDIEDKNIEIFHLESQNENSKVFIVECESQYESDLDSEIHKHKNRQRDILNKIKEIEKDSKFFQLNDECPTCTQHIDATIKSDCISRNDIVLGKLATGNGDNNEILQGLLSKNNINVGILDRININKSDIRSRISNISRLKKDILKLETSIKTYKKENNETKHDISGDIQLNNDNIEKFNDKINKINSLIDYYNVIAIMLNDDGVKSLIIKKYLPLFNRDINDYLNKFGLNVKFVLDEQFNETILSRGRDNFSYNSFSEGEKLRVDLALLMSFRNLCKIKNSVDSNLLIMDEVFDSSLSQQGVDAFTDVIMEQKELHTIVITHTEEKLSDKFQNKIEVSKLNNFSEIKHIEN